MSKRDEVFKLFDGGKTYSSPEVKALKLKANSRRSYYSLWRKARGLPSEGLESGETVGGDETIGGYEEKDVVEKRYEEPPKDEKPKDEKVEKPEVKGEAEGEGGGDGTEEGEKEKKVNILGEEETEGVVSEKVIGFGIHVGVHLSLKTLALYQIASSIDGDLKLGKFIDDCVADWFVVRGQDLGMVKLRR